MSLEKVRIELCLDVCAKEEVKRHTAFFASQLSSPSSLSCSVFTLNSSTSLRYMLLSFVSLSGCQKVIFEWTNLYMKWGLIRLPFDYARLYFEWTFNCSLVAHRREGWMLNWMSGDGERSGWKYSITSFGIDPTLYRSAISIKAECAPVGRPCNHTRGEFPAYIIIWIPCEQDLLNAGYHYKQTNKNPNQEPKNPIQAESTATIGGWGDSHGSMDGTRWM